MIIEKVRSKNFAGFGKLFEVKFSDHITSIIGPNGAGKSHGCGLENLMATINGIAESSKGGKLAGERARFIGPLGKSADKEIVFLDQSNGAHITIKNHITEASNKITISSDKDGPLDEEFLKSFMNVTLMSWKHFCALSGQEQARTLGINTSSFDDEMKELKAEATEINAAIKAFGEIPEMEKVGKIDISALQEERNKCAAYLKELYEENCKKNEAAREKHQADLNQASEAVEAWKAEQQLKRERIVTAKNAWDDLNHIGYTGLDHLHQFIEAMPKPETEIPSGKFEVQPLSLITPELPDRAPLDELDQKLFAASENNMRVQEYEKNEKRKADKAAKEKEKADNAAAQKKCEEQRKSYMAGENFGFSGLATNEAGELMLDDGKGPRPIKPPYFSTGELIRIVAKIYASLNPVLKTIFIDDFDVVDDPGQEKILKELDGAGFQIITMEVRKTQDRENTIMIKECVVDTGEERKPSIL